MAFDIETRECHGSEGENKVANKGLGEGVFVDGFVGKMPVVFTADTGASRTILSSRVYDVLSNEERPQLKRSVGLRGAGGSPIRERGKAVFNIQLGELNLAKELIVADIEDDALLGYDILVDDERGPADLLLSQDRLVLRGIDVPCRRKGKQSRSRKVIVADDICIPGQSETLVDVFIERTEDDDLDKQAEYIVEPSDGFKDRY